MTTSLAPAPPTDRATAAGPPPEPYRGIAAFRFADAQILLARETETEELVQLTTVYRGVLLFGESGVGKSSMLNAGFIPEALRLGFNLERIRVRAQRDTELLIECITTDSGGTAALPSVLMEGSERHVDGDPMSIVRFRQRLAELKPSQRTILIFDQFEEFISLFEDAPAPEKQAEAREIQAELLQMFEDLHHNARLPIKLLFSFREDYLGKLAPLIRRIPALGDHFIRLAPLRAASLRTIVEGPLTKFPDLYGGRLQAGTTDLVIRQFSERVGGGDVNLSEVQIVCRLLWDDPSLGDTLATQRIDGLLDRFLTNALELFKHKEEKDALKLLLSYMVTRGGVRNVVSLDGLLERAAERTSLDRAQLTALLAAVDGGRTRLVRSEKRQDVVYYTILSEFLIRWIRQWREEFAKAEEREALSRAFAIERQRKRRRLVILAVVGAALIVFAVQQYIYLKDRRLLREIDNTNHQLMVSNDAKDSSLAAVKRQADSASARAGTLDSTLALQQHSLRASFDSVQRSLARDAQAKTATLQEQLKSERDARLALQRVVEASQQVSAVNDSSRTASGAALDLAQRELALERQRSADFRSQTGGIARQLQVLSSDISDLSLRAQIQRLSGQLPGAPPGPKESYSPQQQSPRQQRQVTK